MTPSTSFLRTIVAPSLGAVVAALIAVHWTPADREIVMVLLPVKAEKRQQFEQVVASLQRTSNNVVKVIVPTAPESDGTYTYIWVAAAPAPEDGLGYERLFGSPLLAETNGHYRDLLRESVAGRERIVTGRLSSVR